MINIVLVSHGELGAALIQAAEMIAGHSDGVYSVPLLPGESPEAYGEKLSVALEPIEGDGILILIDLFGGTPYNVAAREALKERVECVTGANLPMLLEVLMSRDETPLSDLAAAATVAGQESVRNLGEMLAGRG
ncbi:MAG: PTS sugar transporter subunit IIA [Chloroflexi bacterium]|nr:PTS sugar transporter subunit IIA [Chloroflexota bacterium]